MLTLFCSDIVAGVLEIRHIVAGVLEIQHIRSSSRLEVRISNLHEPLLPMFQRALFCKYHLLLVENICEGELRNAACEAAPSLQPHLKIET
jgi:hypothetical protein